MHLKFNPVPLLRLSFGGRTSATKTKTMTLEHAQQLVRDLAKASILSYRATNEMVRTQPHTAAKRESKAAQAILKELIGREVTEEEIQQALE